MPYTARIFLPAIAMLFVHSPAFADTDTTSIDPSLITSDEKCHKQAYPCAVAKNKNADDINTLPITINASSTAGDKEKITYEGDVIVRQGHRTLESDTMVLTTPGERQVTAEGNVIFNDGEMLIQSDRIQSNLTNQDTYVENAKYRLLCQSGRGEAKKVFKNGTTFYQLDDGTYTTCPEENKSWRFGAKRIEKKDDDIFADMYGTSFQILNTPVFYLPYLRVPVEDGRLTGFLYPTIGFLDEKDGISVQTPFYWNIHPQADMLFTPKLMSNRGTQLTTEFNYLVRPGNGSIITEYMPEDREYPGVEDSWGINWRHSGVQDHWLYDLDYSRVSDITYFSRHTDSQVGKREDSNLLQTAEVAYREDSWDAHLKVRDFQPLTKNSTVYRLMPQLALNYYGPNLPGNMSFTVPSQISRFETDTESKPDATRLHIEPTLTLPYNLPWLQASAEAKLLYTYYEQDVSSTLSNDIRSTLGSHTTRSVPVVRLNSTIILEREQPLWGTNYLQTLEPRIQYLYVKDVDQSQIYNPVSYKGGGYDTVRLQTDYYGLFRTNQYSNIDYINSANQFTLGASTRFYDDALKERFNLSVGQIFYVDRPFGSGEARVNYSAWALETEINVADHWFLKGSMEYDNNISKLQFANSLAEYRNGSFFTQASYRFVSKDYIASTLRNGSIDSITEDGISQVGLIAGIPITDRFSLQGQYFHDLTQDIKLENQVGLVYRDACWQLGLTYSEYLLSRGNISQEPKFDSGVSLSFSLLGLGANAGFGFSDNTKSALGYYNPYGLKN
ncbi:LPS assembly protein LptD [Veronia pacifica]|uniref:LPS-assembly protein LptD n=1 Tax=Veronia pacifica TaxID=1080227 RepID=A0A1C3EPZ4_9GAMM|nr:LPS assembly protein LptD [Veronia pacifica]ODA35324.1 LPS assembly protein LptD [Veronia pacifica]